MSKSNAFEQSLLALVFNATAIADIAENDTSSPATQFWLALHTADPGEAGTQATSEANYTSYARVAVVRTTSGWTVSGGVAVNFALVQFPQCTGGSSVVTHVSVGMLASGAGLILYSGPLSASLSVTNGIQPQYPAGTLTITED